MAGFRKGKGRVRRNSMRSHSRSLNQLVGDRL